MSQNDISDIEKDAFIGLPRLQCLNMSSNMIRTIGNATFDSLVRLRQLNLSNNLIESVIKDMFKDLERLEYLDLRLNMIEVIDTNTFASLKSLKCLDIRNNPLAFKSLSVHIFIASSNHLTLKISPVSWFCDCESLENMKRFMYENKTYTEYFSELMCYVRDNTSSYSTEYKLSEVYMPKLCQNQSNSIIYKVQQNYSDPNNEPVTETKEIHKTQAIIAISVILAVVLIGFVIFGLVFKYRKFLKIWCFIKFGWKFDRNEDADDANRKCDAFVSYSSKDAGIVVREILPRSEEPKDGRQRFKMCIHHRDFPLGGAIAESIIDAVNKSKRVIMLLSNNFLRSEWCQYEFQKSHFQLLKERKNRIIMIILEEINPGLLYKEIELFMKTTTYVRYNGPWLWPKIEYAMPGARPINEENAIENAYDARPSNDANINDNLELNEQLVGAINKKVQVGKDQEKAQSEKDSHSKNRGGKKPN